MASSFPDGDPPANEGGDHRASLSSRPGAAGQPAHSEARAELRDRETYYAQLRFAVHCQSRSITAPRPALDDHEGSIGGRGASATSAQPGRADQSRVTEDGGIVGETWDEMIARFGDTWT